MEESERFLVDLKKSPIQIYSSKETANRFCVENEGLNALDEENFEFPYEIDGNPKKKVCDFSVNKFSMNFVLNFIKN